MLIAAVVGCAFAPAALALDTGVEDVAVTVDTAIAAATAAPATDTATVVEAVAAETTTVPASPPADPPAVDPPPPDPAASDPSRASSPPPAADPPPAAEPPVADPKVSEPVAASTPDPVLAPEPPPAEPVATAPEPPASETAFTTPLDTSPPPPIDPVVVPIDVAPVADSGGPAASEVSAMVTGSDIAPAGSGAEVTVPPVASTTENQPPLAPGEPGAPVPIVQPLNVMIALQGGAVGAMTTHGQRVIAGQAVPVAVHEVAPIEATPMSPWSPFGPIMSHGDGPGSSRAASILALFMGMLPFAPHDGNTSVGPPPTLAVLVLGSIVAAFAFMMFPLRDRRRSGPRGYAALALRPG